MKRLFKQGIQLVIALFAVLLIAVSQPATAVPSPQGILMSGTDVVNVGKTVTLKANVLPPTADQTVIWSSENPTIATVSASGVVTGIDAGKAKIVATSSVDSTVRNKYLVEVIQLPDNVSIEPSPVTIAVGTDVMLTATVLPSDTEQAVTWKSSNTKIATVDAEGFVTAKKLGKVTITARTVNGKTASTEVTIIAVPKAVAIAPAAPRVLLGATKLLKAVITPTNSADKLVYWQSSDESVATVDANGLVTAKKLGTTTITVSTNAGYLQKSEVLTVDPILTAKITASPATLKMPAKTWKQLNTVVTPANITRTGLTYTSSNPVVASVTSTGLIRALTPGSAKITVASVDGAKTATVSVTVKSSTFVDPTMTPNDHTLVASQTVQLTATGPSGTTRDVATWTSSNTQIATVSSTGLVTARAIGDVTITASYPTTEPVSATLHITSLSQDRAAMLAAYAAEFGRAPVLDGWNGNAATCSAGTTTTAFQDSVIQRINFYRMMSDMLPVLRSNGTLVSPDLYRLAAQYGALLTHANNKVSYVPTTEYPSFEWKCLTEYTANGEANEYSNIIGGKYGVDAIDDYILDANDPSLSNRRPLLKATQGGLATGDIPEDFDNLAANTLYLGTSTVNSAASKPLTQSWPPAGYFPDTLVPSVWSFDIPGQLSGRLTSASVTVTRVDNDSRVTVTGLNRSNTQLSFVPAVTLPTSSDITYRVVVSGVTGASASSYTYDVTLVKIHEAPKLNGMVFNYSGATVTTCSLQLTNVTAWGVTNPDKLTISASLPVDATTDNASFRVGTFVSSDVNYVALVIGTRLTPTKGTYKLKIEVKDFENRSRIIYKNIKLPTSASCAG